MERETNAGVAGIWPPTAAAMQGGASGRIRVHRGASGCILNKRCETASRRYLRGEGADHEASA